MTTAATTWVWSGGYHPGNGAERPGVEPVRADTVKTIPSCKLKSGETLSIEYFEPGPQVPASLAEEITRFVIQVETLDSWPSVAESLYLKRCLQGRFAETGLDPLFLGRLDGRIAGDVGCQVSRDCPEVGSLGWVFTDPAQRGKGISSHLTRLAVQWFQDRGGVCMLLGTGNPIAHHVYEKYGFRDYNGHVMRRLSPGVEAKGLRTEAVCQNRTRRRPACRLEQTPQGSRPCTPLPIPGSSRTTRKASSSIPP